MKLRCFTCSNHHMTKKGTPSQYLALCPYFRDQNLHKQKELLKTHKMCAICLNPKSKCSDKSPSCQLQVKYNLKCKCGDTTHHSLMCPHPKSDSSYYQSNNDYQPNTSQRGGRGGSHRGRGARGGRRCGQHRIIEVSQIFVGYVFALQMSVKYMKVTISYPQRSVKFRTIFIFVQECQLFRGF